MWNWIEKLRQFVNRLTNQVLGRRTLNQLVDANIAAHQSDVVALNTRLASDAITISHWEIEMRTHIKNAILQQYMLGRGGSQQLAPVDFGSMGGMLSEQYRYLGQFAAEIASGNLTLAKINQRSVMYIASSREAFARANARAYGIPLESLPGFPGQGTLCDGLTNCKCSWRFVEKATLWECYWELGQVKERHCAQCPQHARTWNPFVVAKATTKSYGGIITRPTRLIFGGTEHPERVIITPLKEVKPLGIFETLQSRFKSRAATRRSKEK